MHSLDHLTICCKGMGGSRL